MKKISAQNSSAEKNSAQKKSREKVLHKSHPRKKKQKNL